MLFNSYLFLFVYVPVALIGSYFLIYYFKSGVTPWLLIFSLIFYGWWNPNYLILLMASISFNYLISKLINRSERSEHLFYKRNFLILGIVCNLGGLFYFIYMNFFIQNFNVVANTHFNYLNIILPLGISFFTFTQIAYLVDTYQGKVKEFNFINYSLFVTYFPHLIADPIIHHSDVMPQFKKL